MSLAIADYNQFVGGVNTFDQLMSYYSPKIRSRRWYIKVLIHFLEVAAINSYTVY